MRAAPTYASGSRACPMAHVIPFVPGPSPPSATNRKQYLNTKHPTAERNRSHTIALYARMPQAIEVFIVRPYSDKAWMDVHSCSQKQSRPLCLGWNERRRDRGSVTPSGIQPWIGTARVISCPFLLIQIGSVASQFYRFVVDRLSIAFTRTATPLTFA